MTHTRMVMEFRGVVKRFGRRSALDGLDMHVPRGAIVGLVGSNGAGKTTAIAVATGLLRPDRGEVTILGEGPFDPARHSGRVSMMPQDSDLPLYARVRDILVFYARLQGIPHGRTREEVERVIEWVHLSDRADSPVRALSHGMRRRIVVAQAFLGSPELVLLDEPMSGLDPREVVNVRNLLANRSPEQTVVISSHNLHELELICDHVAFIEKGRLVRQDTMAEITGRKQSLNYILAPGRDLPLADLRERLPDISVELQADGTTLSCGYSGSRYTVGEVNAIVLGQLLENDIEIIEVRRGQNLEQAYITQSAE